MTENLQDEAGASINQFISINLISIKVLTSIGGSVVEFSPACDIFEKALIDFD